MYKCSIVRSDHIDIPDAARIVTERPTEHVAHITIIQMMEEVDDYPLILFARIRNYRLCNPNFSKSFSHNSQKHCVDCHTPVALSRANLKRFKSSIVI